MKMLSGFALALGIVTFGWQLIREPSAKTKKEKVPIVLAGNNMQFVSSRGSITATVDNEQPPVVDNRAHEQVAKDQFDAETKNDPWALRSESKTIGRLYQSSLIHNVRVSCKSSLCRTDGEFEARDATDVENALYHIRLAGNFKTATDASTGDADNTVYEVIKSDPLKIRFFNYSRQ